MNSPVCYSSCYRSLYRTHCISFQILCQFYGIDKMTWSGICQAKPCRSNFSKPDRSIFFEHRNDFFDTCFFHALLSDFQINKNPCQQDDKPTDHDDFQQVFPGGGEQ